MHVVQDSEVRAPQKYPAPLTMTVNHGSLRSTENRFVLRLFAKPQAGESGLFYLPR